VSELDLAPSVVAWATLEPVHRREHGGHRPVLEIAPTGYLDAVTTLMIESHELVIGSVSTDTGPATVANINTRSLAVYRMMLSTGFSGSRSG
jgi:hypothetical protein